MGRHGIIKQEVLPMTRRFQAVYENGAFRPLEPVSCHEQERVLLTVESAEAAEVDLIDHEFLAYCATQADDSVPLEAVRQALAKIPGSLVPDIRAERDER
jgi:predicted DNA-binding antitoxin AbrB/MazE fold protein